MSLEPKLKLTLKELIQCSGGQVSADSIIKEFSKPQKVDKTIVKKHCQILKNLTKNNSHAVKPYELFEKNIRKYRPAECLKQFLSMCLELASLQRDSPTVMNPSLCSTKIEEQQTSPKSILDIKKRVTQAASEGLSPSAQSSSLTGKSLQPVYPIPPPSATTKSHDITRKHSLWYFCDFDKFTFQENKILAVPISNQEQILVTELLYCLIGIRGTYIMPESISSEEFQPLKFTISEQIDSSLRDITSEIIPLASHYHLISKFIQLVSLDCGQILQAFCGALREYIHHYYLAIVQLESEQLKNSLTLHKLFYYLRPITTTMDVLADVVADIWKMKIDGGTILTLLYDKIICLTGDIQSQNILIHLTEQASIPYIEMLQLWIFKGVILSNQPLEFFIEDNEISFCHGNTSNWSADYWEKRYTLRRDRVPRFLENVSDIILQTGKYLNVMRQCGQPFDVPASKLRQLHFSPTNQEHLTIIKSAYNYASKSLLELLINEKDLLGHLMSLKRYLLLFQGDIVTQFMDASEDELMLNVGKVRPMKLENLLGLTLRTSSAKHDPYKDNVHCELFMNDLMKQMSQIHLAGCKDDPSLTISENVDLIGIECFSFQYVVEWPVSLIVHQYAHMQYQMIFRQLFFCKHVERQLCKVWTENKNFKVLARNAELYRLTFSLRQRMMYFVQNLLYYIMVEVIEPMWHEFIENVKKVENVDDLIALHQDFLDITMLNCLLKNPDLLCTIISLCNVCLEFCKFLLSKQSSGLPSSTAYLKQIRNFDDSFTKLVVGLLRAINYLSHENSSRKFTNLVHRINFNSYYTDQLEIPDAKNGSEIQIDEFY